MADGPALPERVRADEIARITGLSVRNVQERAAAGMMPGAAKLGGVWTFDPIKARAWVAAEERKAWRVSLGTSTSAARHGGDASRLPASSIEAAFAQMFGGKRRSVSKPGGRSSNEKR